MRVGSEAGEGEEDRGGAEKTREHGRIEKDEKMKQLLVLTIWKDLLKRMERESSERDFPRAVSEVTAKEGGPGLWHGYWAQVLACSLAELG